MGRAATVHFTTDLGASVSVETTHDKVLEALRYFGAKGWYSGSVPPGGLVLPYDNEPDFDWALLGGYKFADKETGEVMVWCRGHVWKRREFEAQTKPYPLSAAIKYSRGAKPTDPPHIREAGAADIEYVTLVVFRGGKRNESYALPKGNPSAAPASSNRQAKSAARGLTGGPIDADDALTLEELERDIQ